MKSPTIRALENVLKILEFSEDNTPEEKEFLVYAARGYILSLLNRISDLRDSDDEDMALAIVSGKWPMMADDEDWEAHVKLRKMINDMENKADGK